MSMDVNYTTLYDNYDKCLKCNSRNKLQRQVIDGSYICECETICTNCGNIDYWAYGRYENIGGLKRPTSENIEEYL